MPRRNTTALPDPSNSSRFTFVISERNLGGRKHRDNSGRCFGLKNDILLQEKLIRS